MENSSKNARNFFPKSYFLFHEEKTCLPSTNTGLCQDVIICFMLVQHENKITRPLSSFPLPPFSDFFNGKYMTCFENMTFTNRFFTVKLSYQNLKLHFCNRLSEIEKVSLLTVEATPTLKLSNIYPH